MSDQNEFMTSDQNEFMTWEDSTMMKQILEIHAPDGRELDVKPILQIVHRIVSHAPTMYDHDQCTVPGIQAHSEQVKDKGHQAGTVSIPEALSDIIDQLSTEITSKLKHGMDMDRDRTIMSVFTMVSSYSWDAKLVLSLAAFALSFYGELCLLAQIYSSNQLAKSMTIIKQLPVTMKQYRTLLKSQFDEINKFVKPLLDLTSSIATFKELPSTYVNQDVPEFSVAMAKIPTIAYWIIKGIVLCISHAKLAYQYAASSIEAWKLPYLAKYINGIHDHLKKQLDTCNQLIDEKRKVEAYNSLLNISDMIHTDNMTVLKALIYAKENLLPLFDGSSKKMVNLEVLRKKTVLLLISSLDISSHELSILEQIYADSSSRFSRGMKLDNLYEIVWIPIVDQSSMQWTESMENKFKSIQSTLPWYTVHHPSLIGELTIKFIKEYWHFSFIKPILVVLDPQGKVVNSNAFHMMWIWGGNAFPFTPLREEALWEEETWRLELLVNGIDQTILNWIRDGRYILVYGGDDMEWIRRLTTTARLVGQDAPIPLEIVYVGKSSSKKERIRRVKATIRAEKLSSAWMDETMIWFFWIRLESMLFSKIKLGRVNNNDPFTNGIKKLLGYDKSGEGWAVLCKGSDVLINGHGTTVLTTLLEYEGTWKEKVDIQGFHTSLKDHHDMLHRMEQRCCRFEVMSTATMFPETIKCPDCLRTMVKHITFTCCHDDQNSTAAFD